MIAWPRLIAITDVAGHGEARTLSGVERLCAQARSASVAVHLRDHDLSARGRWELGLALRRITHRWRQQLIVGERIDLALCLDADGLHLPEWGVSPSEATRYLGLSRRKLPIFAAYHPGVAPEGGGVMASGPSPGLVTSPAAASLAGGPMAARRAGPELARRALGVSALVVSPVFAARKGRPAIGLAAFRALAARLRAEGRAVYSLGGVEADTAAAAIAAGATGVAIQGALLRPLEPLVEALGLLR